jgi:hypothetical protein
MSSTRFRFYSALAVGLFAVALFLPQPQHTKLWRAVFDAGHAPLFGLIAILLLRLASLRPNRVSQSRVRITIARALGASWGPYVEAFAVTALLSAAAEAVQIFGRRDADVVDFLRDVAGALAFLLLALALDRSSRGGDLSRFRRVGLIAVSALLLLAVASPVVSLSVAMLQRDAAMPLLCDFESRWSRRLWSLHEAELDLTSRPEQWGNVASHQRRPQRRVARIDFRPATYPGLTIVEPSRDWSSYEILAFDVFSELDSTVTLVVRIDDVHAYRRYEDRFNRAFDVHPGLNQVRVALSDVMAGPRDRTLDLSRVRRLVLFAHRPESAFSLYVDDIRLE